MAPSGSGNPTSENRMKEQSGKSPFGIFLLGFLCAAVLSLLLRLDSPQVARADTSGANGEYIALTGQDSTGTGLLYILNAKEKRIAVYQWEQRFFYFLAVRDLKSDFSSDIEDWTNEDHKRVSSKDIREEIARQMEKRKPK